MQKRNLTIVLTMLLALGWAQPVLAKRICDQCKNVIKKGRWIEVDDKYYHAEHFSCAHCSEPIGSLRFYEQDGSYYDSACYTEHIVFRCGYCSKPILSSYIEDDSAVYHSTCFYDHVVDRCMVCKNALMDAYYDDSFGNMVCSDDFERILKCQSCARFMIDGPGSAHLRYPDGRMMCASCQKTAIHDLDEAGAIMKDVVILLGAEGIDITPEIKMRLVTLDELSRLSDGFTPDQMGITIFKKQSIAGGYWSNSDYKICILFGLPAYHFRVIMAHELMHVWLFKNGRADKIELTLCEGSCNYASYLILSRDKSEKGQLLLERFVTDDDPVYGEGFRKTRDFIDKVGIEAWLEYLTKYSQPPW